MLSATSQSKHAARFLRLAMASIMDILKIKPFVEVSVGQLLWGYEDPLLKLAKDVVPKEQKLPYDEFGLMYGKNGTFRVRFHAFCMWKVSWFITFLPFRIALPYGLVPQMSPNSV